MKYLRLIWEGIWRKPGRTTLTLLQVIVAFLLFGLLQGMKSGIDDAINKLRADIYLVRRESGVGPLPLAMYGRIQSVPGVKSASLQDFMLSTYQKPSQEVWVSAADMSTRLATMGDIVISPEALQAMKSTRTGLLASESLARKYGWHVGERIPLQTQVPQRDGSTAWTFDLVGIFKPTDESGATDYALMNYAYFDESRHTGKGNVNIYFIAVTDVTRGAEVARAVDSLFANSSHETRTQSLREVAQSQLQSLGDLNFVVRAIVAAVLFALIFSTSAMMMQSIRERTGELAVMKTLGFSDNHLFWIVLAEAVTLCVVAAAVGIMLAAWIMPVARHTINLEVRMPETVAIVGIAIAAVVGIATAIGPAWRARRLVVVQALAEIEH